jgi:PAS domain S-box-containing protein
VSATYFVFGVLWILLSDRILAALSIPLQHFLQTIKGLVFISTTALLLYIMLQAYYRKLDMRAIRLAQKEAILRQTRDQYRDLFESGPLPKYIFDAQTLKFLYVNERAIEQYGYTRQQFLSMSILDIRREEDHKFVKDTITLLQEANEDKYYGNLSHLTASGEVRKMDVYCHGIKYHGRDAVIVVANDVTERVNYINAIEEQNRKLQEISWMQSHLVRAPLASIMGCAQILQSEDFSTEDKKVALTGVVESAEKLDDVIRKISQHSERVIPRT